MHPLIEALVVLMLLYIDWRGAQLLHRAFGKIDELAAQLAARTRADELRLTTPSKLNARTMAYPAIADDAADGAEEGHGFGIVRALRLET